VTIEINREMKTRWNDEKCEFHRLKGIAKFSRLCALPFPEVYKNTKRDIYDKSLLTIATLLKRKPFAYSDPVLHRHQTVQY